MDTKTKILDAAESLIKKSGINATSFQKISDVVGIRKASLYHHFANKDALICAMIERCRDTYSTQYIDIVNSQISAVGKLKAIIQIYEDGLVDDRMCIIGMLSAGHCSLGEATKLQLQKTICNTIEVYSRIFAQGQQDKSINNNISPQQMATMFFYFLQGAQLIAKSLEGQDSFRQAVNAMLSSIIL